MEAKDVEKYDKRYKTYVGAKTTETFVDSFIPLYTCAVKAFVPIKDVEDLQRDLKKRLRHHQRAVREWTALW